jgi:hypothetical protein
MGWGQRTFDRDKFRDALMTHAVAEMGFGKPTEKTYLAALYAEQIRTNELLERLLEQRPGAQDDVST